MLSSESINRGKIVEAHGSFARQRCIECKTLFPDDLMKSSISKREVPHCLNPECNGLVKPDIVFFGEALPEDFHANRMVPSTADLCIVMGTSLTVQPFASLPSFCAEGQCGFAPFIPGFVAGLKRFYRRALGIIQLQDYAF